MPPPLETNEVDPAPAPAAALTPSPPGGSFLGHAKSVGERGEECWGCVGMAPADDAGGWRRWPEREKRKGINQGLERWMQLVGRVGL